MNFTEIEKLRVQVSSIAPRLSGMPKVILYNYFYSRLFASNNKLLIEAYSSEFIKDYCQSLADYLPYYAATQHTDELLLLLDNLLAQPNLIEYNQELEQLRKSIDEKLIHFNSFLRNENAISNKSGDLSFPLIGKVETDDLVLPYYSLEKIKVKISPAKEIDTFIFIPSNYNNEQLKEQAHTSLELAKNIIKEYKHRIKKYHEVLIYFENLSAEYDGNSFGVALTIGLIEQLSLVYNLPYIAKIKDKIASTGGIDIGGNVLPVGNEAIKKKVETVFYSDTKTFILPKKDEEPAIEKLAELNEKYPERKVRLVAVDSLTDLLERRNLISLKKQPKVVRATRGIKKHWLSTILILLLTLILLFLYVRDYDDNPAIIEAQENTMFIKNKSGKILWTRAISYSKQDNIYKIIPHFYHILEDINDDGINEVIVSQETFPDSLSYLRGRIACFDNKGILIWQSMFRDTVRAKNQIIDDIYNTRLVGIVNEVKRKILLCTATNGSNFPSAVFKLDALNGDRIEGTLWNPGHIMVGLIRKKENGKHEIVCNMYNNDYQRTGIFGIDYENLSGTAPYVQDKYKLLGLENAKLNFYLLVPNTDYNKFYNNSNNIPALAIYDEKRIDAITFSTYESTSEELASLGYEYKNGTGVLNIVIVSYFKVRRDSLVAHGKLYPPYTDTPEYKTLLESQVLYWNGKEFVTRDKLQKKRLYKE